MAEQTIPTKFKLRHDIASNWTAKNPVLLEGEVGFETNTFNFKVGNGTTAWNSLSYYIPTDYVTTDTEQIITAIKTIANSAQILNEDGQNILNQTPDIIQINNILKELWLYSNGRIKVNRDDEVAYLSDIPTLSTTTSGTFGSIFQASMSLGGLTVKFGLNGLTPKDSAVTTKTITFDEPFKEYCAATISGCSSASTLRTTNLNAEITKTGLTAAIYRTNTTYTYFSWIAVGV